MTAKKPLAPFVHYELLAQRGEDELGKEKYVFILARDYQTNGCDKILQDNIKHSAAVMNGTAQQDLEHYPFVRYKEFAVNPKRKNCWTFISRRNIADDIEVVEVWMNKVASVFPGAKPDTIESHPLCDVKIKWESTSFKPLT